MGLLSRGAGALLIPGIAALCPTLVSAEPPKPSMAAEMAAKMTEGCLRMRMSEGAANSRARKLLGKPTAEICQQAAATFQKRIAELQASAMAVLPLFGKVDPKDRKKTEKVMADYQRDFFESYFSYCRSVAEKVAKRPLEIVWCTSPPSSRPTQGTKPPDELWDAIDDSPFEGIAAKQSPRDERLREVLERRLSKDLDQLQIKADMEEIGFDCGVWTPQGKLDRNITTGTPKLNCTGYVGEMASAPARGLLLFRMQINVTVKFSETGEPRGWQQIEVKTGEGHL